MLRSEKSEKVLVDEKEPEEFLFPQSDKDEPGRGDCRKEQESPGGRRLFEKREVFFGPQEKQDGPAQKQKRYRAFRQDREAEGRPREVEEEASSFPVEFIEARKRGEEKKGKKHVDRDDAGHGEEAERSGEDEAGDEADPARKPSTREEAGEKRRREAGKRVREPERPFIDPEDFVRGGAGPVEQGRLLEIADVIEMGNDIIARLDHLPGDLRIPAFIGLLERIAAEVVEKNEVCDRKDGEGAEGRLFAELSASHAFSPKRAIPTSAHQDERVVVHRPGLSGDVASRFANFSRPALIVPPPSTVSPS